MAFNNGLKSKVSLPSTGIQCSTVCCLRNSGQETYKHVFAECFYSQKIWAKIYPKFSKGNQRGVRLTEFLENFLEGCRCSSVGEIVLAKLYISAFIWHVWKEWNSHIFCRNSTVWEVVLKSIQKWIQSRFLSKHVCIAHDLSQLGPTSS